MAERAALAPNLSGLALHETRAVGMKQEEDGGAQKAPPWKDDLPPEIWRLIVEFSHLGRDVPEIAPTCDRLADVCKVAANAPWGSKGDACGEYGWLYDRANALLGFYRDFDKWQAFSEWAARNVANYKTVWADWFANPRAYFHACCRLFRAHRAASGTRDEALTGLLISRQPSQAPWARAFISVLVRRNATLLRKLPSADRKPTNLEWLRDDYTHYAKIALAQNGLMLTFVPGSVRWLRNDTTPTRRAPTDGYTDAEFAELAQIAIKSSWWSPAVLTYVPGAMNAINTTRSPPIPQFVELARTAVRLNGRALKHVPGSISQTNENGFLEYDPHVSITPIPEYVELAKLAVKNNPDAIGWVPGVLVQAPSGEWIQTAPGEVTDAQFIEIAKVAIETVLSRPLPFVDAHTFRCIPDRLQELVFGAELLSKLEERFGNMTMSVDP